MDGPERIAGIVRALPLLRQSWCCAWGMVFVMVEPLPAWWKGLRGSRMQGRVEHPWPPALRALVAAVFMRAVRDVLGLDWVPVSEEDRESALEFLRSGWAVDLAWALGLDAGALAAVVEGALADPAAGEALRTAVRNFCVRGRRGGSDV